MNGHGQLSNYSSQRIIKRKIIGIMHIRGGGPSKKVSHIRPNIVLVECTASTSTNTTATTIKNRIITTVYINITIAFTIAGMMLADGGPQIPGRQSNSSSTVTSSYSILYEY